MTYDILAPEGAQITTVRDCLMLIETRRPDRLHAEQSAYPLGPVARVEDLVRLLDHLGLIPALTAERGATLTLRATVNYMGERIGELEAREVDLLAQMTGLLARQDARTRRIASRLLKSRREARLARREAVGAMLALQSQRQAMVDERARLIAQLKDAEQRASQAESLAAQRLGAELAEARAEVRCLEAKVAQAERNGQLFEQLAATAKATEAERDKLQGQLAELTERLRRRGADQYAGLAMVPVAGEGDNEAVPFVPGTRADDEDDGLWACPTCPASYPSERALMTHRARAHGWRRAHEALAAGAESVAAAMPAGIPCPACEARADDAGALAAHMTKVHRWSAALAAERAEAAARNPRGPLPFPCGFDGCGREFEKEFSRQLHWTRMGHGPAEADGEGEERPVDEWPAPPPMIAEPDDEADLVALPRPSAADLPPISVPRIAPTFAPPPPPSAVNVALLPPDALEACPTCHRRFLAGAHDPARCPGPPPVKAAEERPEDAGIRRVVAQAMAADARAR